jgi:hypothetical protein
MRPVASESENKQEPSDGPRSLPREDWLAQQELGGCQCPEGEISVGETKPLQVAGRCVNSRESLGDVQQSLG